MNNQNFAKTLAVIAATTDPAKLRLIISNTIRLHGEEHDLVRKARERLEVLLGPDSMLDEEYERMRQATIKVSGEARLSILRRNHGVVEACERLMKHKEPSAAFHKIIAAGRANETVEAIILRHPERFSATAVATARERLARAAA